MNDPSSDAELRSALTDIAPRITLDGKWDRVQTRSTRTRRVRRLAKGGALVAGLLITSLMLIWVIGAFRTPNPVLVLGDALEGAAVSAPTQRDNAEELRQAWRDRFLEGLWSGNVDTVPERPASLPSEFWKEPDNPLEIPNDLDPSFEEGTPLWIFTNELPLERVLSVFDEESGKRPVLVFSPPAELLDLVDATTGQGEEPEPGQISEAENGDFVLLRLPDLGWQIMRVGSGASKPALSGVSAEREAYEDLARATLVELRSFAKGDLLNADRDDEEPGSNHEGKVIFAGTWGDSLGQFARGPAGQTSFAYDMVVGPKEYLFVLDPVGKRVQVISPEGLAVIQIPLRAEHPTDVAVSPEASVFVNDADGSGQVQVYGLGGESLGIVTGEAEGSRVVDLAGVCIGGYGGVWAGVREEDGTVFFTNIYRFAHPHDTSGSDVVANQPPALKSPFSPLNPNELAPLGLAWWGSVLSGRDDPYLSVSGPRGPFEAWLDLEDGSLPERADVVSLVESLNGDDRDAGSWSPVWSGTRGTESTGLSGSSTIRACSSSG